MNMPHSSCLVLYCLINCLCYKSMASKLNVKRFEHLKSGIGHFDILERTAAVSAIACAAACNQKEECKSFSSNPNPTENHENCILYEKATIELTADANYLFYTTKISEPQGSFTTNMKASTKIPATTLATGTSIQPITTTNLASSTAYKTTTEPLVSSAAYETTTELESPTESVITSTEPDLHVTTIAKSNPSTTAETILFSTVPVLSSTTTIAAETATAKTNVVTTISKPILFVTDTVTWLDANYYCQMLIPGGSLMIINSTIDQQRLQLAIEKYAKDSTRVWIGMQKQTSSSWHWVDGTIASKNSIQNWGDNNVSNTDECVNANTVNDNVFGMLGKWVVDSCDSNNNPFICQQNQYPLKNYTILTYPMTYLNAEQKCTEIQGGTWQLAVFKSKAAQTKAQSDVQPNDFYEYYWWIGGDNINKDDFTWLTGEMITPNGYTNWAGGQPLTLENYCLHIGKVDDTTLWYTAYCDTEMFALCERVE